MAELSTVPIPFRGEVRPRLGLDVEIEDAGGSTITQHCDDQRSWMRPFDQSFGTARGDGFTTAGYGLHRPMLRDYKDVNLLDTTRFIRKDGSIAYEGRLHSDPRTNDPDEQLEMNQVGWATYLRGRRCAALIVDRRTSGWQEPTTRRKASVLAGNEYDYSKASASAGLQDIDDEVAAAILFTFNSFGALKELAEMFFYGGGEDIAEVLYSFIVPKAGGDPAGLINQAGVCLDDMRTGAIVGTNHKATPAADQSVSAGDVGFKYAMLQSAFVGAFTGDSGGDTYGFAAPAVIGDHGLTKRGAGVDTGFWLTDIQRYLIARYRPKIRWADTNSDNPYPVRQATWHDSKADVYTAIQQMNDLALWETNVWENREFHTYPADLTKYDWLIRTTDAGVKVNFQGDSIENFANGAEVTYTGFDGVEHTLYPSDHPELRDEREDNPANRQGEELWTPVDVPRPCTEEEALQYGRAYLGEFNRPKRPGSYQILSGYIRDFAYHLQDGTRVRNGQTMGILDHPDDNPRLIVDTRWNPDNSLTIAVDAPPKMLDAIIARQQRAREGANLT